MELKFNEETKRCIKLVDLLNQLVELEFNVSKEKAEELVNEASEFNVDCSAEVLGVIEDELGQKSIFRSKK